MNDHQTKLANAITTVLGSLTVLLDLAEKSGIPLSDLEAIDRAERLPTAVELRRILSGAGIEAATFFRALEPWAEREARHLLQHGSLPAPPKPENHGRSEAGSAGSNGRERQPRAPSRSRTSRGEGKVGGDTAISIGVIRAQLGPWFKLSSTGNGHGRDADKSNTANGATDGGEVTFRWSDPSGVELDVCIFTSINNETKEPNPLGTDAIRVVVFDARSRRKIEPWSSRIYRVKDWPTRLRRLVGEAVLRASYRPRCKNCKDTPDLRIVGNPGSQFWGCPNYTKNQCRYTRWLGPRAGFVPLDQEEEGAVIGERERPRQGKSENRSRAMPPQGQSTSRAALAS